MCQCRLYYLLTLRTPCIGAIRHHYLFAFLHLIFLVFTVHKEQQMRNTSTANTLCFRKWNIHTDMRRVCAIVAVSDGRKRIKYWSISQYWDFSNFATYTAGHNFLSLDMDSPVSNFKCLARPSVCQADGMDTRTHFTNPLFSVCVSVLDLSDYIAENHSLCVQLLLL